MKQTVAMFFHTWLEISYLKVFILLLVFKPIAQFNILINFPPGQRCFSERFAVRIAAGAWCLGCFFLVQIYCTTLTSHLTAPNQKPIVNSFDEIAYTPGARLAVDRGYAIDSVLMLQVENNL